MDDANNIGAFVFHPEGYAHAGSFEEVQYSYWPLPKISDYLQHGGKTEDGLMNLLIDFNFGEEFLVMIVEFAGDNSKRAVHIHKITQVGLN